MQYIEIIRKKSSFKYCDINKYNLNFIFFRELKNNNIANLEFDSLHHLTQLKKL